MKAQVHIKEKAFEELVIRRGWTYKDLAKELNITRVYLHNLKNEDCPNFRPSAKLRTRILTALKCKFDDIFVIKRKDEK